jgi:3D (Asp-Asp-Asp) domain-containing protein
MEMDKSAIDVIMPSMKKGQKTNLQIALLLSCGVLFFLFSNEIKTPHTIANAGENDSINHLYDNFFLNEESEVITEDNTEQPKEDDVNIVPEKYEYDKTIWAKVTAYTPGEESCGKFADGFTSIGRNAWVINGVAAAPKVIPYGSWVHIPGVGYREVDDTGSAMRKSWTKDKIFHVDLRFQTVKQAREWGIRWLPVHIYKEINEETSE